MRAFAVTIIAAALLACSCVYTIHPISTEETAVFDPVLVGTWSSPSTAETWEFAEADGWTGYTFNYTDPEGRLGVFNAVLTEIDGTRFIQFTPNMDDSDDCGFGVMNDFYRMHFAPMNTFAVVRSVEPELVMDFPDFQWLDDYLATHPDSVPHEVESVIYLTGSTGQLRTFLGIIAQDDGAFSDGEPLIKNGPAQGLQDIQPQ